MSAIPADCETGVFFAAPTTRNKPSADLLAALSRVMLLRREKRGTVKLIVEAEG